MSTPPIPAAATLLSDIRSSCEALRVRSNVLIDEAAADAFLLALNQEEYESSLASNAHGIRLPLRFESPEEELNLISTLALLNFLSGYRTPLHRLTTRGAWSTILSLVLSAHLSPSSSTPLSTTGMLACTPASLANLAQIQTHTEKDHPTMGPAVRVGEKDAEAWEVLELLVEVLKGTGEVLKKAGKKDLGAWMKETLVETGGESGAMVEKLATTFPAFADAYTIDGGPVYIFKKALFLLSAISLRFSPASYTPDEDLPEPSGPISFPLPDITSFPIFADNVIPTMLIHHHILSLTTSTDPLLSALPSPLPTTPSPALLLPTHSATALRAASISACAFLVARAKVLSSRAGMEWMAGVDEGGLDGLIWSGAKRGNLREVQRVAERGTVFY